MSFFNFSETIFLFLDFPAVFSTELESIPKIMLFGVGSLSREHFGVEKTAKIRVFAFLSFF